MNKAETLKIFANPEFSEVYLESEATTGAYERHFAILASAMPIAARQRILDVGVAHGSSSLALFRHQPSLEVLAADPSPTMLELAEAKFTGRNIYQLLAEFAHNGAVLSYLANQYQECHKFGDRITFIQAFAEDIDRMPIGQFDHVMASASLHWLVNPEKAFSNFSAILKPKGTVGISSASWKYDMDDPELRGVNKFGDAPFVKAFSANLNRILGKVEDKQQQDSKWNRQMVEALLKRHGLELYRYSEEPMAISLGHLFSSCKVLAFLLYSNYYQSVNKADLATLTETALADTIRQENPLHSAKNYYEVCPYIVARKI